MDYHVLRCIGCFISCHKEDVDMSLEIITGTKEEWDAAIPCPQENADILPFYSDHLSAAQAAGESHVQASLLV